MSLWRSLIRSYSTRPRPPRWIIETIANAFMQVIIIVVAFARAAIALADDEPCYQLQKHRKQTHT